MQTTAAMTPQVVRAAALRIDAFDRAWSRFRAGSVVDAIRAGAGAHRMPVDADPLLALYDRLYAATDGAMSPAVGDGLEHLGYDATYSLRAEPGHRAASPWSQVRWEPPLLHTTEPFVLDVGAAGKGYLADLVAAEILAVPGAPSGVSIDASGDLLHRSPGELRVALEHPERPGYAVGVAVLEDAPGRRALCCSATNRRRWPGADGEVHHVLDARTGKPVDDVLATWVIADSALVADGLATALFFLDLDAALRLAADLGAAFVRLDRVRTPHRPEGRRLRHSPDFSGEIFS